MRRLLPLLILGLLFSSTARATADDPFPATSCLKLRVSQALPVVGERQTLTARISDPSADLTHAAILFRVTRNGQTVPLRPDKEITLSPGENATTVSIDWTPATTGECLLEAVLKTGTHEHTASQRVTVVKRPLHFHYWHMDPSLKYVTEGLVQEEEPLEYWTDRGAVAQRWVGGIWAVKTVKRDTVEKLVASWTGKRWPGIVIDEFGSPGEVDRLLAAALIETRKRMPELYLAPYAISPSKETFEAFRAAADRVLVECYCPDGAAGYKRIESRTGVARDNGFLDKTLTVLGIGNALGKNSPTVTTPVELRRQLHFLRYRFPEMSGAAFFSGFKPLYPALNDAIRRFYIMPVLRVEPLSEDRVKVENIGADDAESTTISLATDRGTVEVSVPALAVGRSVELDIPKDARPLSEFREPLTVLAPPLVWEDEPESNRPGASDPWPLKKGATAILDEPFESNSPRFEPAQADEGGAGESATAPSIVFPFEQTAGKPMSISFDLDMIHAGFYGGFHLVLENGSGPEKLNIHFYRGDYEPGVYAGLSLTNADTVAVAERLALRLKSGGHYRLKIHFDGSGHVRAAIDDASSTKLWDTGNVPTYGSLSFDRVRVGVRQGPDSFIRWSPKQRALHLRGRLNETYYSEAMLDNLRVETHE